MDSVADSIETHGQERVLRPELGPDQSCGTYGMA